MMRSFEQNLTFPVQFICFTMTIFQLIYSWQSSKVFASGSVHEEIIQWWNKASVQKPLKCTINPSYLTPLHEMAMKLLENAVWKPILYSEPCGFNEVNEYPFVYKGDQTYIAFNHIENPSYLSALCVNIPFLN